MNSKLDGQPLNFLLCYWQTKGKKTKDNNNLKNKLYI